MSMYADRKDARWSWGKIKSKAVILWRMAPETVRSQVREGVAFLRRSGGLTFRA